MGAQVIREALDNSSTSTTLCTQVNGSHEGHECEGHDKGCYCRGTLQQYRTQEESLRKDSEWPRRHRNSRSQENWCIHNSRPLQDQNQSKASTKSGEGLSSLCLEEERMRRI